MDRFFELLDEFMPNAENLYVALVPVLDSSKPNFRAAGWRAVEAAHRFQVLLEKLPNLGEEWKGHPVARASKLALDQIELSVVDWNWSHTPAARAMTLLASEILHHSRVALDYCAYNMVWLDGGEPKKGTSFPLVTDESKWSRERRRALPGISVEHAEWVRGLQPFRGVEWSSNLAQLSNRDKHWMAADVLASYRCRVDKSRAYADPLGDDAYVGYEISEPKLELSIAPAMGSSAGAALPLKETLVGIINGVVDVVNLCLSEVGVEKISVQFVPRLF